MIYMGWAVGLCSILWPNYAGAVPATPSPSSSASSPTTSFNVVMDEPANGYLWVPQRDWENFQRQGVLFNTNALRTQIGEFGLELETSVNDLFSNGDTVIVELALGPHIIRSDSHSHLSAYGVFFSQVRRYQAVEDREQANEAGWTVNDGYNSQWNQFGAISGQTNYGVPEMRQMDQRYLNSVAADHFTRALLHFLTGPSSILNENLRQTFRRLIGWGEEEGRAQLLPAVTNPLSMDSIVVHYLSSLEANLRLARYGINEDNLANGECPALIRAMAAHLGLGPSLWGRAKVQATEIPGSCENAVSVYCRQQTQDGLCEAVQQAEQTDVETCNYFKSLEVKLTLGNGVWGFDGAGTVDDIVIEFGKHDHQTILKHPSRGDEATISVDLEKAFGSKEVLVEAVKSFKLYSVQDQQKNPDSWEIGGLYIYGTCVESSRRAIIKKYDNVYDWFNRFGDINPEYGSSHFNGHIDLGDWQWETPDEKTKTIAVMPPGQPSACSKFKSLEAYLELGKGVYSGSGAGTNDDIMLDFSDDSFNPSDILLMSSPSRGDSVTKPVDLKSVFGKSVVSPKDIRQVSVYSEQGTSHWADPWEIARHPPGEVVMVQEAKRTAQFSLLHYNSL
ncbi:hypothetical protein MAC_04476 [Metarhizium acridum CQMa 102]|uniref:Uncharacterized protein n=1 Tax=Metarhizium acridum (strain CQMa 102) TaxID=655827 RepID=E9E3N2_METAQ|nr:uncharacterized protein MAC_04476 [Metarhizium acridum CQMa 102]EFY89457.1 hypothetical protein MAC_04476 [Metarhizium acridum CQMa 102]